MMRPVSQSFRNSLAIMPRVSNTGSAASGASKSKNYRPVASDSFVDESLFASPSKAKAAKDHEALKLTSMTNREATNLLRSSFAGRGKVRMFGQTSLSLPSFFPHYGATSLTYLSIMHVLWTHSGDYGRGCPRNPHRYLRGPPSHA